MCYEIYHVPIRNASKKSKTFHFGIYASYDVSGCYLKEYPKNINKGMQNTGTSKIFITMLQIEANGSKNVK